ncbi:hypothetical protein DFR27_1665 [Umboniibacter marinipuniceus]|uniref:Orphan protein n=2 Tax=Umboniibacter marinipuniceus TaxID=569599 RepID=A0A3M0A6S1_9GAMM|nr:hypothetical protein DFR27_1665 [Umboniibacter marinipuniceus]
MKNLIALVLLMLTTMGANAHQYHFGLTEISVNENERVLEVVHKYFIRDIAVAINGGTDIAVGDEELKAYLAMNFKLALPELGTVDLEWVGAESDIRYVWMYQQYQLGDHHPEEVIVEQKVLVEIEPDQVNTVTTLAAQKVVASATLNRETQRAVLALQPD